MKLEKHEYSPGEFGDLRANTKVVASPVITREPEADEVQPIESALKPVQSLTADMLPEPLEVWAADTANRLNCPLDFVAVSALVLTGSLIGSRLAVQPKKKDGWHEVSNLWGGIIAPPSSKKSPAISAALNLLKPLEKEAMQVFESSCIESKVDIAILEAQKKQLLSKAKNEAGAEEARQSLINIEEKLNQAHPSLKRYQVNDSTPEKLADICTENPQGVLVFRDELTGLLKSFEKQGNEGARAFYLEAWNGKGSYTIDRIARGSSLVETLCVSVFGGIQPDKIQAYLSKMDEGDNDGLIQRFQLLVYPDPIPFEYIDRYPDRDAERELQAIFKNIAHASLHNFMQWGAVKGEYDKMPKMQFTDEAQSIFVEWYKGISAPSDNYSSYEQQHFAKYGGLMPCLALIFQVLEAANNPSAKGSGISAKNARLAVRWCDYLKSHAERIYHMANAKNTAVALSKKVSAGLLPSPFTPREVQQKGWQYLTDSAKIKEAIAELVDAGWLFDATDPEPKPGRTSYKYLINPAVKNWYQKKLKHLINKPTKPTKIET